MHGHLGALWHAGVICLGLVIGGCGSGPGTQRIAILGMTGAEPDSALRDQAELLVDLLTARLSTNAGIELVERADLDALLEEQGLSLAQTTGFEESVRVGKLLRADLLLMGTVVTDGTHPVLLAKLVDARSSAIRNVSILPVGEDGLASLADPLQTFVEDSRNAPADGRRQTFLAVGKFENVSLVQRDRDFGDQLRRELTARFPGDDVTVLERDMIGPLLDELRLSALGMGESDAQERQAQAALVLVDGVFQSFQDETAKLNLILRVERVGETVARHSFNEPRGDALNRRIEEAIRQAMNARVSPRKATRFEESQAQLKRGMELARIRRDSNGRYSLDPGVWESSVFGEPRADLIRDGIKALQSAVFLDPANEAALLCLGMCHLDKDILEPAEALSYLNELLSISTHRLLRAQAKEQVAMHYMTRDPGRAHALFRELWDEATSARERNHYIPRLGDFYRTSYASGTISRDEYLDWEAAKLKSHIDEEIELKASGMKRPIFIADPCDSTMRQIVQAFGGDLTAMRGFTDPLMAGLEAEYPRLKPFFIVSYTIALGEEVPPDIKERYLESLRWTDEHSDRIQDPESYYPDSLGGAVTRFYLNRQHDLLLGTAAVLHRRGNGHLKDNESDQVSFYEGWVHRQRQEWDQAIEAFERIGSREVRVGSRGAWGPLGTYHGRDLVAECRRLKGDTTPPAQGPPTENLPPPVLAFPSGHLFTCDGTRLWILVDEELHSFRDGELRKVSVTVSNRPIRRVVALASGEPHLWLGTQGDGLLAMDKETGQCRQFTMDQGLLQNHIHSLHVTPATIWVGFGNHDDGASLGGMGFLDRVEDRFVGVMGELNSQLEERPRSGAFSARLVAQGEPTRQVIRHFAQTHPDHVLGLALRSIFRFTPDTAQWETIARTPTASAFSANDRYLAVTTMLEMASPDADGNEFGPVSFMNRATGTWKSVARAQGLPDTRASSVLVDGNHAWVGGMGYLARLNIESGEVEKVYLLTDRQYSIRNIEVNGDHLWLGAHTGTSLYRDGSYSGSRGDTRLYRFSLPHNE